MLGQATVSVGPGFLRVLRFLPFASLSDSASACKAESRPIGGLDSPLPGR